MGNALHTKGAGAAGVTDHPDARLDDGGLLAVGSGGLISTRTGVLIGPGATALVSGTSSTAPMRYSVAAHHWVTNRGVVSDGVYRGAAETAKLVDTTAAPATGSRVDVVWVKQNDAGSTISPDATSAPVYGCTQGASSTGTPAVPAIPVGAEELARVTVTSAATRTDGAGVTISQTAKLTTGRGGPVAIRTAAELATLPAYPSAQALELDTARLRWHDGNRWRWDGDRVVVGSAAERDALAAYNGLEAIRTDTGRVETYIGGQWRNLGFVPWTDLGVGATTYNQAAGAGWADLPGLTGSITAPAGSTIEAEFVIPRLRIEANGGMYVRLIVNGVAVDSKQGAVGATAVEFPGPTLVGSQTAPGGAVNIQAQIRGTGGGGYVMGAENNGPRLRAAFR